MSRDPLAEARAALAQERARRARRTPEPEPAPRRGGGGTVRLTLSAAQARVVNDALALIAATPDLEDAPRLDVLRRTREAVWAAMDRAGVEP